MARVGRRAIPVGLALAYLALVVAWSAGMRFNAAPDEYSHFFLPEYLLAHGGLPRPGLDPAAPFRGPASGAPFHAGVFWYYGLPNPQAFGAALTGRLWLRVLGWPASPLALRAVDWLLAPVFVLAMAGIARRGAALAGAPAAAARAAVAAAVATAAVPQVVFLFTYLNNDAWGITAAAVALAALLRFAALPTRARAAAAGLALGLFACAKLYLLPAAGLMAAVAAAEWRRRGRWPAPAALAWLAGAALAVAVPVLGATWAWYGDAFGMAGQRDFARLYGGQATFRAHTCFVGCPAGPVDLDALWWWLSLSFKSFFYDLGWLTEVLPLGYYQFFFLPLCLLLIAASAAVARAGATGWPGVVARGLWVLLLAVVVANLAGSQRLLPQPQGRYLYAVLPFVPLLAAAAAARPVAGRWLVRLAWPACAVMLVLDVAGAGAMHAAAARPVAGMPGFQPHRL